MTVRLTYRTINWAQTHPLATTSGCYPAFL